MIHHPMLAFGPIGSWELLVILFVVLLLFGAKRLPELARSLGQAKKEFTKAAKEVSDEVEKIKEVPLPQSPQGGDSSKKVNANPPRQG